jgi:diaminopimelate epimerase
VHGIRRGELANTVTVHLPGGKLSVSWRGTAEDPVWLGGPTATVFDGVIRLRSK